MRLHGYFRSAASYRVRIALNLKGLSAEAVSHHLRRGEQHDPAFLALNPQGLVPVLELDDGQLLTQSLAIIEWLDETHPEPALLPRDRLQRARVRAFAGVLAIDTHPLQNLRVLRKVIQITGDPAAGDAWAAEINQAGLEACERLLGDTPTDSGFCFGDAPSLADICLVPQLANALRFGVDVSRFPRLMRAESAAKALPAFALAAPERQADAE